MSDVVVRVEESGGKGRYTGAVDGRDGVAEMTFSRVSPSKIIVDHTEVPDSMRGLGVGAVLAQRVVDDARKDGFQIVPLCPFFNAQFKRHPEWADVVIEL